MASAIFVALANRPTVAAMTATTRLTDNSIGDTVTGHSASQAVTAVGSCGTADAIGVVTFLWAEAQNCDITSFRFTGRASAQVPSLGSQCNVSVGQSAWVGYTSANYAIEYAVDAGGMEPTWLPLTSGAITGSGFGNYLFTTAINARYLRGIVLGESYQEGVNSIAIGSYSGYGEATDYRIVYSEPPCSPPSPPTLTIGQVCSTGGVSLPLSWGNITAYYEVERSSPMATIYAGTGTTVVATGLTAAVPEYFRIRAMDSCGTGMWSAYTTGLPKTFITAAADLTGTLSCCGKEQSVSWADVAQAATYSLYHRVPVLDSAWYAIATGTTLTTYDYSVPAGERLYNGEWGVVPANDCGNGPTGTVVIAPLYSGSGCIGADYTAGVIPTAVFTAERCG